MIQKLSSLDYAHHLTSTSITLLVSRLNTNRQELLRKRKERDFLQQLVKRLEEEVSLVACDISDEASNKGEVSE
jgi:hypothetical protein